MAIMTPAQARENFFAAMETLRSSKVRSALTVLGIVIGVSSVLNLVKFWHILDKLESSAVCKADKKTSRFGVGEKPTELGLQLTLAPRVPHTRRKYKNQSSA